MGNPRKVLRKALSDVLDTAGVYFPRSEDDFPVYGVFVVPTTSSSVSTADFRSTRVNLLNVLDKTVAEELRKHKGEKSDPKPYRLSYNEEVSIEAVINAFLAATKSKVAKNAVHDIEVKNTVKEAVEDGRATGIIHENLRRKSILIKLLKEHAVEHHTDGENFILGIVLGVHTATLKLCVKEGNGGNLGASAVTANGNAGGEVGAHVEKGLGFEGSGIVGLKCVYIGVRKEDDEWRVSKPIVQTPGNDKSLQKSVHYAHRGWTKYACIRRRRPGHWRVDIIDDLPQGNAEQDMDPNYVEDGFLGLPGRELADSALVTDMDTLKDEQFWNDVDWDAVE